MLSKEIMKYALISGAGSGLAQALISAIKDNFVIFALDINPSIIDLYNKEQNIHCFSCDVTDIVEIQTVKEKILKMTTALDLLINFASVVELGSVVEVKPQAFEKSISVNVLGMYQINHAFFPLIKQGKGRIIMMSSEYGRLLGLPFHSFYTISKHAMEIYSDSLRREVRPFGVKVIKIRPGSFKTEMVRKIQKQFEVLVDQTILYNKPLMKMQKMMINEIKRAQNPNRIIKVFRYAIYKKHPRLAYNIHNSLKMKLLNILPHRLQDWILGKFFGNK
jgi:short-subunit dehydrogenase